MCRSLKRSLDNIETMHPVLLHNLETAIKIHTKIVCETEKENMWKKVSLWIIDNKKNI